MQCVVCDTPAWALIKGVVGHTGFGHFERCVVKGQYILNWVKCQKLNCSLRTDKTFRSEADRWNHIATSPLLKIKNFDMVYGLPLDYMHLVFLGVVKRLFTKVWQGTKPHRLSQNKKDVADNFLGSTKVWLPSEFKVKGNKLSFPNTWKALEFRTFLLYIEPIAMESVLNEAKYEHFIYLQVNETT